MSGVLHGNALAEQALRDRLVEMYEQEKLTRAIKPTKPLVTVYEAHPWLVRKDDRVTCLICLNTKVSASGKKLAQFLRAHRRCGFSTQE